MSGRRAPDRFDLIRTWADERGLYDKGDTKTQYLKLMEEAGEIGRAILKNDEPEFIDAIGDMVVVLTNLARLGGVSIETCIASAPASLIFTASSIALSSGGLVDIFTLSVTIPLPSSLTLI